MGKYSRRFLSIAILAVAYFIAGRLALMLAFLHPSASAVWPNSGLALATLVIFGLELWPGVFIGAFFVNLLTAGSAETSLAIAAGNSLEALLGAWLVCRFALGPNAILRAQNIFKFILLAGVLSTTVAATVGVTSLALAGFATWHHYWSVWFTWWLGDAAGDIIIAPVLLTWVARHDAPWKWARIRPEALLLLISTVVAGQIIFNGVFVDSAVGNYPLAYLCIPFLTWSAFRFGQRETSVTMLLFSVSAVWGTLSHLRSLPDASSNQALLHLLMFLSVAAALSLVLAAEVAERRQAEAEALELATTDPLTGLGNYRKFFDAMDAEIRRGERSKRTFALLLLDLDGLKQINDLHGHLTGNRALCRLADAIRLNSRSCDITARYGGDEFAVLLHEADRQTAYRVASRIRAKLAEDRIKPPLSVSVGVALWPVDGTTFETLLETADVDLYDMKGHSRRLRGT